MRDRETANAPAAHGVAAREQDVPIGGEGRLHDADAILPFVLPEHGAVGGRHTRRSAAAEEQDLRDAVNRREMRRAVATAAGRACPARVAFREV